MKPIVKYVLWFTAGCVILHIWLTAINAPFDSRGIYGGMVGVLSAILVEGRKKSKHDRDKGKRPWEP